MSRKTRSAKSIFAKALEIETPQAREAYLEDACGGNAELRSEVADLLAAFEQAGSFLKNPAVEADAKAFGPTVDMPAIAEAPGQMIGRYKLLQQIGEGGMGSVYMAEQEKPIRRRVALKIIKLGMDSKQVIARFEAERQALALMEHQNIARVLDAGTTKTGRPYFVMELVKGVPITEYCDNNKLTPRERLQLFKPVCLAIQHAHQKGIIHRDIKPSNVLICLYDGQPVPKVIDFGVAKATEQRLTEKTMFTQHGQIVGTLEYMSPEQAEMSQLDIDTRSDIYSLGVLLYELLTGTTPITREELRQGGFTEMLRLIRESEPEKPSTRLSHSHDALPTISAQRRMEPAKLDALFRGDLDWIVMKALEKDRIRRYETASDFARDIQRHLDDEPVEACPPSARYRLRKFAHKHRAALSTAAALAVILMTTTGISLWQAYRATRAERVLLAMDSERTQLLEQATHERNRALAAEQSANEQRVRAEEVTVDALHALGQSAFHSARAILASNQPGRRWAALDAIRVAHDLLGLSKEALSDPGGGAESLEGLLGVMGMAELKTEAEGVTGARPTTAQLRTAATAALLQADGRLANWESKKDDLAAPPLTLQWEGQVNAVSGDGRFLATASISVKKGQIGLSVIEVETGKEVWSPDQKNLGKDFPMVMAISSGGKQLASFSVMSPGTLKIWDLAKNNDARTLTIPGPSLRDALRETAQSVVPGGRLPPADSRPDESLEALSEPPLSETEKIQAYREIARKAFEEGAKQYRQQKSAKGKAGPTPRTAGSVFNAMLGGLFFSPDGHWLSGVRSAGGARSDVLLWDLRGAAHSMGRVIATIDLRPQLRPAFSPDSRLLAWPDGEGTVTLWNLVKGEQETQLELPLYLHGLLTFTPDGSRLVTHGHRLDDAKGRAPERPGHLLVWDIAGNRAVHTLETSPRFLATAISVAPDGERVAVGQMNGEMLVIDLAGGSVIRLDHGAMPMTLNWTPDGKRVISAGIGACKVWELSPETAFTTHGLNTGNHDRPISRFALSPDGKSIAIEQLRAGAVELFDLQSGERTGRFGKARRFGMPGSWLVFSPDGKRIVRAGLDGVRVWNVDGDGQPLQNDMPEGFKGNRVTSMGFRDDDTLLLCAFDQLRPSVKEALSGKVVWRHDARQPYAMPRMSRDGSLVAFYSQREIGKGKRMIEVCRLPDGEAVCRIPSARKEFNLQTAVDISPDNRWLIEIELGVNFVASYAGTNPLNPSRAINVSGGANEAWRATLWSIETGETHWEIKGDAKTESMVFSPDGRYFAIAQRNGRLVLWDIERKERILEWQAWESGAPKVGISTRELAFTADSRKLAVAAETGPALRLLDLTKLNVELAEFGLGW